MAWDDQKGKADAVLDLVHPGFNHGNGLHNRLHVVYGKMNDWCWAVVAIPVCLIGVWQAWECFAFLRRSDEAIKRARERLVRWREFYDEKPEDYKDPTEAGDWWKE